MKETIIGILYHTCIPIIVIEFDYNFSNFSLAHQKLTFYTTLQLKTITMYTEIIDEIQMVEGSKLQEKSSSKIFELGSFDPKSEKYNIIVPGVMGTGTLDDDVAFVGDYETIQEGFLIEKTDIRFYDAGEPQDK